MVYNRVQDTREKENIVNTSNASGIYTVPAPARRKLAEAFRQQAAGNGAFQSPAPKMPSHLENETTWHLGIFAFFA